MSSITPVTFDEIRLSPVEPEHVRSLFRWATDLNAGFRWRFGGATPSIEQFHEALWSGVLCQYVAMDAAGQLHGLVACHGADHHNGMAYFAVQGNPARPTGSGAMIGLLHLLDHVFTHWRSASCMRRSPSTTKPSSPVRCGAT